MSDLRGSSDAEELAAGLRSLDLPVAGQEESKLFAKSMLGDIEEKRWALAVLDEVEALRRGIAITHIGDDPAERLRHRMPTKESLDSGERIYKGWLSTPAAPERAEQTMAPQVDSYALEAPTLSRGHAPAVATPSGDAEQEQCKWCVDRAALRAVAQEMRNKLEDSIYLLEHTHDDNDEGGIAEQTRENKAALARADAIFKKQILPEGD